MRSLDCSSRSFIMCVGVTGIFIPDTLISVGCYVVTPNGRYSWTSPDGCMTRVRNMR